MLELFTFLWAAAEGIFWPFMPEALLVPLAVAVPDHFLGLVLAAMCGSGLGGIVSYALTKRMNWHHRLIKLPFIRPSMLAQCRQWLSAEGIAGIRHQPLSMLPFKVFAVTAAELRLPLQPFIQRALWARGQRFALVTLAASLIGKLCPQFVSAHAPVLLALWAAGFYGALCLTTQRWTSKACHHFPSGAATADAGVSSALLYAGDHPP